MSTVQTLCSLFDMNPDKFTRKESVILEMELFTRICEQLKDYFRNQQKDYFSLIKLTVQMEEMVLETNFMRLIIEDILLTEEYTLKGIAYYADVHEDVIYDVVSGYNHYPSAILLRKVIELHRSVRPELYRIIIKKITAEYLVEV